MDECKAGYLFVLGGLLPPCLQACVDGQRNDLEAYLLQHANAVPTQATSLHGVSFRMARTADVQPSMTALDLLHAALQPDGAAFMRCNPFLPVSTCKTLHAGVLLWLRLCVLEDRLGRALALAKAGQEYTPLLIQVSQAQV